MEADLSKFPAVYEESGDDWVLRQDFGGGLSKEQIQNLAHSVIHNVASLRDHLLRWAGKDEAKKQVIRDAVSSSQSLKIVIDLWDNDKHGYPRRDGGLSGVSPHIGEARRVLRLSTGPDGGGARFMVGGGLETTGSGKGEVVLFAPIMDGDGNPIGEPDTQLERAVADLEQLLQQLGLA